MITGDNINEFIYTKCIEPYSELLELNLLDLECKHVMQIDSKLTEELYERGIIAGHSCFVFGSHRNGTMESECKIIESMCDSDFKRPVRIIKDKFGRIWADNTHSVIAYLYRNKFKATLKEIPIYLVDLSRKPYKIVDIDNTVLDSIGDIRNAIACAERINNRIDLGYRPLDLQWTIKDLMQQLGMYPNDVKSLESFM